MRGAMKRTGDILGISRILGVRRWQGRARRQLRHRGMPLFWLVTAGTVLLLWGQGNLDALWGGHASGATEECRVIRVVDGDGVRLDCGPGRESLNVRLYWIDAPESDQEPWASSQPSTFGGCSGRPSLWR